MERQTRTLITMGVIAAVGLAALTMLAGRYRKLVPATPTKSVADLPAAPDLPDPAAAATASPPPLASPPAEAGSAAPKDAGATKGSSASSIDTDVSSFIAARLALLGVIRSKPLQMESLYREMTGNTQGMFQVKMYPQLIGSMRSARSRALQISGLRWERYQAIRDAYKSWKGGDPGAGGAMEIAAAFERRKADLAAVDLGKFEELDYLLAR